MIRTSTSRTIALVGILLIPAWLCAEEPPASKNTPAAAAPVPAAKLPAPVDVQLDTKDGVQLQATFYPSPLGKGAVPVILLHMWKGSRADYDSLAQSLQQHKHAVLVPDLRGHGRSTRQLLPDGSVLEIDKSKLNADDYVAMVTQDMEACKAFLMKRNNLGELNISKLCVVGAEMGAAVAMNWAYTDWNWPPLATGRQGQDVRALVLISPETNFKGIRTGAALEDPDVRSTLSVAIVVGKNNATSAGEAERLYKSFKRYHPDSKDNDAAQDLFYAPFDTALQGTKIFEARPLTMKGKPSDLREYIADFIDQRLARNKGLGWSDRKGPLDQ
jgi:pimeloyl-ACP methyl ester carboxylesterase